MTTRSVTECDRCHYEIKEASPRKVQVDGKDIDLCKPCGDKVQRLLNGAALEVPP